MKDCRHWHRAYEDPLSSLSRRIEVVRARLTQALDMVEDPVPHLLSLCAGEGRDVIPVLASRGRSRPVIAVLVESDHFLAERAAATARKEGLEQFDVRCADASSMDVFADALPVDVLMLCGIFGNVDPDDVRRLIAVCPAFLSAGGFVIWTRGRSDPDRRPEVRTWFEESGFAEIAFDGEPEPYGVGLHRLRAGAQRLVVDPPTPLFTFCD